MRTRNRGYYYVSSCALSSRASSIAPPWTSALHAKDNLSKGVTPNAITASSSGTSPVIAETQKSLMDNNRQWLG